MKKEYIVTNDYLSQRGLDLNDYALDGTCVNAIIQLGLDLLITRISYLDDNKKGEESVELALDNEPEKVNTFFKAQYRVIYNLIFQNETSPTDAFIDNIICHELGWGKINGWQKGVYYRHDR
ncbi:MAG: hypothetical protein IJG09_09995 [Methanobrevibacter sp.]|nr:hypothetical protein [Methanobrevibacter sp.]